MKKIKIVIIIYIAYIISGASASAISSYSELDTYLGEQKQQLSYTEYSVITRMYEALKKLEETGDIETANTNWKELERVYYEYLGNEELTVVPKKRTTYKDMSQYYRSNISLFKSTDYDKLIEYEEKILYYEKRENYEEVQKYQNYTAEILSQYSLDYIELSNQIYGNDLLLALYDIETNSEMIFREVNNIKKIDISDIQKSNHAKIWDIVKKLFPEPYLSYINEFKIGTDGQNNMLAYVYMNDTSNNRWRLSIDYDDSIELDKTLAEKQLIETLVHELAHIITLNPTQMQDTPDRIKTYEALEGKTLLDSYLNRFVGLFWKEHLIRLEKIKEEDEIEEYYKSFSKEFVSRYAFTNPEEDIAESFRVFVLFNKPLGNNIADQKIRFFYRFDEMIELRKYIRSQLEIEKF